MKYDIIGDIHGHAEELIRLLNKLGYYHKNGYYQHEEGRKVIFLGDFIDRGPKIRETLQLVKDMMTNGTAEAVMGNHEYNAICYHLKDEATSEYLRMHTAKNTSQHERTLAEFASYQNEWEGWIQWFLQLPIFIEKENFRVVHACWDDALIAYIKSIAPDNILPVEVIYNAQQKGTLDYEAIERTLKGKEEKLPEGFHFHDKDGTKREDARIKWWLHPDGLTFDQFLFGDIHDLKGQPILKGSFENHNSYSSSEKPVFIGHYWLNEEDPVLQTKNVVCLDYSVAKGGKLVAYRWNGEIELNKKFIIY